MIHGAGAGPRIGLTGGIGSGKSTVGAMLAAAGAALIDADALSRATTARGGAAVPAIAEVFGSEYIDPTGALDRARMRECVFADPASRARLEAIVHPFVLGGIAEQSQAALQAGARLLVLDIPLLVESGRWAAALDAVVVVDCRPETQIERVLQRSALPRAHVQAIMNAQASRTARRRTADAVVYNDGLSVAELETQVLSLARSFGL